MISFDLRCNEGHVFEGWFGSSADYESQRDSGLVSCPLCGDSGVTKAPMAPNVAPSRETPQRNGDKPTQAQAFALLRQLRSYVEKNADYVGEAFAEEARRIHYGEVDERGIYGETTEEEAEELREEGIAVARIPWLPRVDQ